MAEIDITFFDPVNNVRFSMSFDELFALIRGSSIKTGALMGSSVVELGLTDAFNLRVLTDPPDHFGRVRLHIDLISTLNKRDIPPVKLQIIPENKTPTAIEVENRIRSLRQLYAIIFLVNAGRAKEVSRALAIDPRTDLEVLLNEKDRLCVVGASEGTFWLTVLTKTKAAFQSLATIAPLFWDEGRQALLDRIKADTTLKKLAVEETETRIAFDKANKLIDLVRKVESIKDHDTRERIRHVLSSSISGLGRRLPSLPSPMSEQAKRLPSRSARRGKPSKSAGS
jgi:hypothetical protein